MATLPYNDVCQLVREPIDVPDLIRHVRAPEDGAIVTFDGFVRNQSHNRPTLYLDYEAYESMALAKMREIGVQLHEKYSIHRVAMVHRLGRLEIGDTSVFIAVSAPHRAAAFDACRFAIETCILILNVDDALSPPLHIALRRPSAALRRGRVRPGAVRPSSLGAEDEVHRYRQLDFQIEYDFHRYRGPRCGSRGRARKNRPAHAAVPRERSTGFLCPARPHPRQRQPRQCSRQRPRR